jgi:hypothetical protein
MSSMAGGWASLFIAPILAWVPYPYGLYKDGDPSERLVPPSSSAPQNLYTTHGLASSPARCYRGA